MEWHFRNDQPIYTQLTQQITLAICRAPFPAGGGFPPCGSWRRTRG